MPPRVGDRLPDRAVPVCDGETARTVATRTLTGDRGLVFVFDAFAFSAIARNWWRRYDSHGWADLPGVPVLGVVRDGPYAVNAFLRSIDSPFSMVADLEGSLAAAHDLLVPRAGLGGLETPRRAVVVYDADGRVAETWVAEDWIRPVPREDLEEAIAAL